MKKFIYGAAALLSLNSVLSAQQYNVEKKTEYDFYRSNYMNLYFTAGNPALLYQDVQDERLKISGFNSISAGDFRSSDTPQREIYYKLGASGRKDIDTAQTFKGSLVFDKEIRKDWRWIFSKEYISTPFLLGDSTTGDTRYNGITLNAEYSYRITDAFSLGAHINYKVDEGLKEISPRPVSTHRTAALSAGASYRFYNWLTSAVLFKVKDYNEEITYSEDEGGLTKETILLKYSGYDLPYIIKKTSENRKVYGNDYAVNIGFSGIVNRDIVYSLYSEYGWGQDVSKDGGSTPYRSGYLHTEYLKTGVNVLAHIGDMNDISFTYNYCKNNDWARHPDYEVLFYESNNSTHIISLDSRFNLADNIKILGGVNGGFATPEKNDFFGGYEGKADSRTFGAKAGAQTGLSRLLNLSLIYEYAKTEMKNKELNVPGNWTNAERKNVFYFGFQDYELHSIDLAADFNVGESGTICMYFNGQLLKAADKTLFGDGERFYCGTGIELKLKLY